MVGIAPQSFVGIEFVVLLALAYALVCLVAAGGAAIRRAAVGQIGQDFRRERGEGVS